MPSARGSAKESDVAWAVAPAMGGINEGIHGLNNGGAACLGVSRFGSTAAEIRTDQQAPPASENNQRKLRKCSLPAAFPMASTVISPIASTLACALRSAKERAVAGPRAKIIASAMEGAMAGAGLSNGGAACCLWLSLGARAAALATHEHKLASSNSCYRRRVRAVEGV